MFHANSWGLALSCPMRGARMVMPGPRLDGASVYDLLETEKVTMTAAVPTVWLGLLQYLRKENKKLSTLKFVGIGGSACPPEMIRAFEEDYGVEVRHAWGMTEMSPVGSAGALKPSSTALSHEEKLAMQGQAGLGAVRRRDEDRRRREQGAAVGRQALRPAQGQGLRGGRKLFQGRGRQDPRRATASSTPAMSPPSIPTASCRSPIAPRT